MGTTRNFVWFQFNAIQAYEFFTRQIHFHIRPIANTPPNIQLADGEHDFQEIAQISRATAIPGLHGYSRADRLSSSEYKICNKWPFISNLDAFAICNTSGSNTVATFCNRSILVDLASVLQSDAIGSPG